MILFNKNKSKNVWIEKESLSKIHNTQEPDIKFTET